jgi:cobalt-zinc-cadmium efflux system membrane fusion protein
MPNGYVPSRRLAGWLLTIGLVVVIGAVVVTHWTWVAAKWNTVVPHAHTDTAASTFETGNRVELVPNQPNTVRIPRELLATKKYKIAPVEPSPQPEPLRMRGSIILDPNRNSRVHSLFTGQVVKVGVPGNLTQDSKSMSDNPERGLRPGDEVKKGQIMAVVYSKDAGALKTDLLTQLTKLWADQTVLERYEKTEKEAPGVVPPTTLTQLRQAVQADAVAVRNAQRNLRASRFTEEEIKTVEEEAQKLKQNPNAKHDLELERTWAEYLVRAPFDGRIVEKNVTIGDAIDPTTDLFKLAKLDRLQVLVDVYEEDLPKLKKIADEADEVEKAERAAMMPDGSDSEGLDAVIKARGDKVRAWTITYQATGEGEAGAFDKIGAHIDPMQHTGSVTGWVNNSQRKLFIGQFVIATVKLKPDSSLIAVPTGAVIESAEGPKVFVRVKSPELSWYKLTDASLEDLRLTGVPGTVVDRLSKMKERDFKSQAEFEQALDRALGEADRKKWQSAILKQAAEPLFTLRKVSVSVRGREQIYLRREPTGTQSEQGAQPMSPDDEVLARGAMELAGELETLQSESKK